jgi:hypothetical protein
MSTTTRRTHHHPRSLPDLLVRHSLIARNRIVRCMQTHSRDSDGQKAVRARRISVISAFGGVPPRVALELPVELVQILDGVHLLTLDGLVLVNLIGVQVVKGAHRFPHGVAVNVHTDPGALQGQRCDFELPGVRDDQGR